MTERELLQAAFAALLRGDTTERDRLIELAKAKIDHRVRVDERTQQQNAKPIPLVRQPDGSYVAATLLH
jgi:hypothetical protein